MVKLISPAVEVSTDDLKLILQALPKNGENIRRVIAFIGESENKFFKPENDDKDEPLRFLTFEWDKAFNRWILKL